MKNVKLIRNVVQLTLIISVISVPFPSLFGNFSFYPIAKAAVFSDSPASFADAIALAAPAVVSIKTSKEVKIENQLPMHDPAFRFFFGDPDFGGQGRGEGDDKETLIGIGSGVIVNDKGYILTNNHVIKEADTVNVTLADGRTAEGKVVGIDAETDLAVLKINLDKLPVITTASSQKLRVGDVVLAIGNPFGFDKTVTFGIVSATERTGADIGILENLIQTDAAINPGNSGGALIDSLGRMVGLNTAIYSRSGGSQGIGFAIPVDQAMEVMNKIIEGKPIIRGYLGIMMQGLNKETRDSVKYKDGDGVYVRAVVRGSPAQKAGILPGDILIKINNVVIKDERMGLKIVAGLIPNQSYPIEIFRKGDFLHFTIAPGERKQPQPAEKGKEKKQESSE